MSKSTTVVRDEHGTLFHCPDCGSATRTEERRGRTKPFELFRCKFCEKEYRATGIEKTLESIGVEEHIPKLRMPVRQIWTCPECTRNNEEHELYLNKDIKCFYCDTNFRIKSGKMNYSFEVIKI